MTITLVAAVTRNGVIGRDGGMPWHLPADLRHFKEVTMGSTMVMGRRTFDTIGRPLPGRLTIVVTRDPRWEHPGVTVAHTLDEALQLAGKNVMVVGGGDVYRQVMDRADVLEITHIEQDIDGDTTFPEINLERWLPVSHEQHDGFAFVRYERAARAARATR